MPTSVKPRRKPLAWVRAVLARTLGGRDLGEAKAQPARAEAPSMLVQQRAELGARLLLHDPKTQVVRHLFQVHDALRKHGWIAVEAMPHEAVARALVEAEILAEQEPTPMLDSIIVKLAAIEEALRPQKTSLLSDWSRPMAPDVSESDFAEFEQLERSWVGTVPAGL